MNNSVRWVTPRVDTMGRPSGAVLAGDCSGRVVAGQSRGAATPVTGHGPAATRGDGGVADDGPPCDPA
jgi:hypothetical protein